MEEGKETDPKSKMEEGMGADESAPDHNKNLIINYLPQALSDELFYDMFSSIGAIQSCRIMRNMQTGYSFGYGFVQYQNPDDADKAIDSLDGHALLNKKIKVSYARPPGQDIKDTNLYVHNLPRNIDEAYLQRLFGPFGKIVQSRLLRDKITNLPRGVAFVRFSRRDEAATAIQALNQTVPEGGTLALNVKVAEDYSKTKQMYMAQYAMTSGVGFMPPHMQGGPRGPMRGGRGRAGAGRGGSRPFGITSPTGDSPAGAAGFLGARPPRPFAPAGGRYPAPAAVAAGFQAGMDQTAAAGMGVAEHYPGGYGDYSGDYGDYSADYGAAYAGYTGGYGSTPGSADHYADATADYGGMASTGGIAAGRGQNRRGSRGGLNKAAPFKTNNRFNPMAL